MQASNAIADAQVVLQHLHGEHELLLAQCKLLVTCEHDALKLDWRTSRPSYYLLQQGELAHGTAIE